MSLGHKHEVINIGDTDDDFFNVLKDLTDEDYNGNNGKEYYTTMNTEFGDISVSRLEKDFTRCRVQKKNRLETVQDILDSNYSDSYYREPSVEVSEHGDLIFISVAYIAQG